jgi:hypothetical protein
MDVDAGKGWQKERMRLEAIKRAPTYVRSFNEALDDFLKTKFGPDAALDGLRDNTKVRKEFLNSIPALLLAADCDIPTLLDPQVEIPFVAAVLPPRSATVIHRQHTPTDHDTIANKQCSLNPYDPEGRFLVIEVDLGRPLEEIRWYLESVLKYYRFDKKGLQQVREDAADPACFRIFDKISSGMRPRRVMQQEYPETKVSKPTNDPAVKKFYAKVCRAHEKAQRLIAQAEQTLQESLR